MARQLNLDTVDVEIMFYPVYGADPVARVRRSGAFTGTSPRIFQHGTIAGKPATKIIISALYQSPYPYCEFANSGSREDFDAIIARYDANPCWSREVIARK